VLDLEPRLRCRECDAREKAAVSIKRWSRRHEAVVREKSRAGERRTAR
jgi:hypothetical protein